MGDQKKLEWKSLGEGKEEGNYENGGMLEIVMKWVQQP